MLLPTSTSTYFTFPLFPIFLIEPQTVYLNAILDRFLANGNFAGNIPYFHRRFIASLALVLDLIPQAGDVNGSSIPAFRTLLKEVTETVRPIPLCLNLFPLLKTILRFTEILCPILSSFLPMAHDARPRPDGRGR